MDRAARRAPPPPRRLRSREREGPLRPPPVRRAGPWQSKATLPEHSSTRRTDPASIEGVPSPASWSAAAAGSSSTSRNEPEARRSRAERDTARPEQRLGGEHDQGRRARFRWPEIAGGGSTAQPWWAGRRACCRGRTTSGSARSAPRSARGPGLRSRAGAGARARLRWPHLSSAATKKLSMMIWAPLAKSPNCASQATSDVRGLHRVPVLETHRRVLRQQRVVDPEAPDALAVEMRERDPLLPRLVVDEHGVALAEGPPPGVLARQPHVGALEQDRPEGERLAQGPVDLARRPPSRARCSNCRSSLGCTVNPSGTDGAATASCSSSSPRHARWATARRVPAVTRRRRQGVGTRAVPSGGSRPTPPAGGPGSPRGPARPPRG